MPSSEIKSKLATLAVFGLPIALVWGTSQVLSGPSQATAGVTAVLPGGELPGLNPTPVAAQLSAGATAAVDRIDALAGATFGDTPFFHPPRGAKATTVATPDPTPDAEYVPDFKIKMIMATRSGNIALIDGARYREGEELGNSGWMITEINSTKRSVSIEHEQTGRMRTRYVE